VVNSQIDLVDFAPRSLYSRWAQRVLPEREWFEKPKTLFWGFIVVHFAFLLGLLPDIINGTVEGDLPLYRQWAMEGTLFGNWPGITFEWVYPIGALLPITVANALGPYLYQLLWLLMIAGLNALSILVITDRGRRKNSYAAAWWWLGILVILSPVALLRLEGITAPLVIIALVLLARRPIVASALLALATWIKVWPAAVFLAVIGAFPRRRIAVFTGIAVSAGVALLVWALGGLQFLSGFVQMQSDRALQLEAPVTTPWLWLAVLHHPGSYIYNNLAISTREVIGPHDEIAIELMTPLMAVAAVAILGLIVWAKHRGAEPARLLLVGALALAAAMVVFNKVGSPQYMLWLAPIIAVGIMQGWRPWRTPAVLMLVISGLTTLIFPILYMPLIAGDPTVATLLTLRNLLVVVLLGWAMRELVRIGARAATGIPADFRTPSARSLVR
jgi:hypothetical protein